MIIVSLPTADERDTRLPPFYSVDNGIIVANFRIPKLFLDFLEKENDSPSLNRLMKAASIPRAKGFQEQKIYPDKY